MNWQSFYEQCIIYGKRTAKNVVNHLKKPASISFGAGSVLYMLAYTLWIQKEFRSSSEHVHQTLDNIIKKWEMEKLCITSRISCLELTLDRTALELQSSLDVLKTPSGGDFNWSKSFIEWKYSECMNRKEDE
eukprot:ctg_1201.g547